jgi:hypothetical protein
VKVRLGAATCEVDSLTLDLVRDHTDELLRLGLYERALLGAYCKTNHVTWSLSDLRGLFRQAARARLRTAGDPLPGAGPFTLYRGVAGPEPERRTLGLSWTRSIEAARWFAQNHSFRIAWFDDPDRGVYRITVEEQDVLAYSNREEEEEFIVMLPATASPERIE